MEIQELQQLILKYKPESKGSELPSKLPCPNCYQARQNELILNQNFYSIQQELKLEKRKNRKLELEIYKLRLNK